jgi:hypothetical protein
MTQKIRLVNGQSVLSEGQVTYSEPGEPSSDLGADGDRSIADDGTIYTKVAGAWVAHSGGGGGGVSQEDLDLVESGAAWAGGADGKVLTFQPSGNPAWETPSGGGGGSVPTSHMLTYSSGLTGNVVDFDNPPDLLVGTDIDIDPDNETIILVTEGQYVLEFDVIFAPADSSSNGVHGLILNTSGLASDNLLAFGNQGQFKVWVDGGESTTNVEVVRTTPPVFFEAGSTFKVLHGTYGPQNGTINFVSLLLTIVRVS